MAVRAPFLVVLAALLLPAPAAHPLETVEEIQDCASRNLPQDSSVQTVVLRAHDRTGALTEMRAKIYWKRFEDGFSRVLLRFSDPPDMRGSALLLIQKKEANDMFMYLPELQRVKRVTGHMMQGSMFGTDFSYEEFERLQGLEAEQFVAQRLPDEDVGGRPAYVIQTVPKDGLPPEQIPSYERIVTWIDRQLCVPLKVEFQERGAQVRKRLQADPAAIEKSGERHLARRMEIVDLRDETRTEIVVEEIELEAKISPSTFSVRELETRESF